LTRHQRIPGESRLNSARGLAEYTLVYFSPIEWNGLRQRPHHLARAMGETFRQVLFVEPCGLRPVQPGDWRRGWRWLRDAITGRVQRAPGSKELGWHASAEPRILPLPFVPLTGRSWADGVNGRIALRRLFAALGTQAPGRTILWTSTPAPLLPGLLQRFPRRLLIYDWIDDYRLFSHLPGRVIETQDRLIRDADLLFASSKRLCERAARMRAEVRSPSEEASVFFLSNGVDLDHWTGAGVGSERPPAIRHIPPPLIGYFGTLSHWVDFELVAALAGKNPSWSFLFIGPAGGAGQFDRLSPYRNIHWIGQQPYERLPELAGCFDLCWIPFVADPVTEAINPVKVYEYLALGKRVVAPPLPDLRKLEPHVILASGVDGMERAIAQGLAPDLPEQLHARRLLAARFRWETLWAEAGRRIVKHLAEGGDAGNVDQLP